MVEFNIHLYELLKELWREPEMDNALLMRLVEEKGELLEVGTLLVNYILIQHGVWVVILGIVCSFEFWHENVGSF